MVSATHALIHLTDEIRDDIFNTVDNHILLKKIRNTMVSEEFQINVLLYILITESNLFQLMVTNQN